MTPVRPRRLRRLASVAMAMVVVSLLGTACGGGNSGSNAIVQQVGGPPETAANYPGALLFPRDYPKPDITLTDTSDQPYDIATATKGQLTLVYFGYTHCPDLCPLNMFTAANAIGLLPAKDRQRVHVVFVTTDPDRDTPAVIRTWLDHFDDSFIGLTGTISQIRQAEELTGLPLSFAEHVSGPGGSYAVVHAGYVLVYTKDNRAHLEFPAEISVTQESRDLESLLNRGFRT